MIERLSHEPAPGPAEDDGRSDRLQTLELLRAQLSRTISEGLEQGSVGRSMGRDRQRRDRRVSRRFPAAGRVECCRHKTCQRPGGPRGVGCRGGIAGRNPGAACDSSCGFDGAGGRRSGRVGTEPSAGFGRGGHSGCLVPAFDGVVRLRSRRPGCDRGTDCFEDGWRRRNDRGQAGRRR